MLHQLILDGDKLINGRIENITNAYQIISAISIGNKMLHSTDRIVTSLPADCRIQTTLTQLWLALACHHVIVIMLKCIHHLTITS